MQPITKHNLFSLVKSLPHRRIDGLQKAGQQPQEFLARHLQGDWGDLCEEDGQETHSASNVASGFSAVTTRPQAKPFTSLPKLTDL